MQRSTSSGVFRCCRLAGIVAGLILTTTLLVGPATASALTNYTWSGAATPSTESWSTGTNWEGSAAPSGTVGTLTFPALTSPACEFGTSTGTCYHSNNDVSGINVEKLSLDNGIGYNLTGDPITLGAGGLSANAPPNSGEFGSTHLGFPITLGAPQTWLFVGNSEFPQLDLEPVTGGTDTLGIDFSTGITVLDIKSAEVGAITATGEGIVEINSGGSLNGVDKNAVSLSDGASLLANPGSTVGPLSTIGSLIQVGNGSSPSGTLAVQGSVTLDPTSELLLFIERAGTTAGTDYSQLTSSGAVNLANAKLNLSELGACPSLTPGDVDTIVETTESGSLTGTFSGIPNGSTVPVKCFSESETPPTMRINYSTHAVTATVMNGGASSGGETATSTALKVTNQMPAIGEAVTYTATVTPGTTGGGEPSGSVGFLDSGQPIGACAAQPLTQGASSSTATCTLSYPAVGSHNVISNYGGNLRFEGSSSSTQTVTVHASSTGGSPSVKSPTGKRARALKKCKKKHGKARARCVKKARKLPV